MISQQEKQNIRKTMNGEMRSLRQCIAALEEQSKLVESDCGVGKMIPIDQVSSISTGRAALHDARERLGNLEQQLQRLEADDEYGICARCGNAIPVGRLMAAPESSLCIECARAIQRRAV